MRDGFQDLVYFIAVARERSFTRAAAQLGMSQSALSHAMRALEARIGVRLLTRTTRSVAPTEAGERLLRTITPRFAEIEAELREVRSLKDQVVGAIRITATDFTVDHYLWPRLHPLLAQHPGLSIELNVDYGLSDIVADRYDIGVRHGDQVDQDMVAVRISPDVPMAIVAHPDYLAAHGRPRTLQDLLAHDCICLRLTSSGGIYAWELQQAGKAVQARVRGRATFNGVYQMVAAARSGAGLAFVPLELVADDLAAGRLHAVMPDCCPTFPGFHAYYPSRRASSRALQVVIDALRHPSDCA
ncbi:LysR family transcriptional regulator [Roseateles sp. BYS96W]|uniref:LysR family transcriptional regulator n=1 Tax=Pelomonas nitida TaxID=3299027 RepID=A0ABW7G107_9BURK